MIKNGFPKINAFVDHARPPIRDDNIPQLRFFHVSPESTFAIAARLNFAQVIHPAASSLSSGHNRQRMSRIARVPARSPRPPKPRAPRSGRTARIVGGVGPRAIEHVQYVAAQHTPLPTASNRSGNQAPTSKGKESDILC